MRGIENRAHVEDTSREAKPLITRHEEAGLCRPPLRACGSLIATFANREVIKHHRNRV